MRRSVMAQAVILGAAAIAMCGQASAQSIAIGSASGFPGGTASVDVVLHTGGLAVTALQLDVGFDNTLVSLLDASSCVANPNILKEATSFRLLPIGCNGNCSGVRAGIISFSNPTAIPDGARLFTCTFSISPGAPIGETGVLVGSNAVVADREGNETSVGVAGGVIQISTPDQFISIESTSGAVGGPASVDVVLHTGDLAVSSLQMDISFDNTVVSLPDASSCVVNPSIMKEATLFKLLPIGCSGNCSSVRAAVISFSDSAAIPDGSRLFTCTFSISPGAPIGTTELLGSSAVVSDPDANETAVIVLKGTIQIAESSCEGDCNANNVVTIGEVQRCTNSLLGIAPIEECPACDTNQNTRVTIGEVQDAVGNLLYGCN